ncbi:sugar phosphate isomerase family [Lactobacillus helsingborgensis]|uniref:hypothetical protein n=1 Tax=Lactobacillus helsingborgensis TaxID=1218494 RepID=UPI00397768A6
MHTQNKINVIGGRMIDTYSSSMITARNLRDYVFDISFMSCRGFSLEYGVTDKVESESSPKHTLIDLLSILSQHFNINCWLFIFSTSI